MVALRDKSHVADALQRLAGSLETLDLGPGLSDLGADRDRLARIIRSYLIPRSDDPDLPATVVFAGPTGSGKSTLVNSLTGLDMTAAGVVRPTTTGPVVLSSPSHAATFASIGGVDCVVVSGGAPILGSLVLVDTPDIDSTSMEHRAIAETLVDNADVVVFVTSALRYADAVPWQVLRRAEARGTQVIHVLNRVSSATSGAAVDFRSRLAAAGLDDSLITVPEHHLGTGAQRVPSIAVRSLGRRLAEITADREEFATATFDRVLRSVTAQVTDLARAIHELADDRDDHEAELSLYLADRASNLYLGGVGDGVYEAFPERPTRLALGRWRRANRQSVDVSAAKEQIAIDRIVAIVHGDMRRWLADETQFSDVDHAQALEQAVPVAISAAEGWVQYVRRIADEIGGSNTWLAEIVLIDAATDDQESAAAAHLWSGHAEMLVDRARRELSGRIEVVYEHLGAVLMESAGEAIGGLDDSDLRAALGAVISTLAPIHA